MNQREELFHYGTPQPFVNSPRGSGRYRKGTGENPYQRQMSFRDEVLKLRKKGLSDKEIMKKLSTPDHEIKSTEFRAIMTVGKTAQRDADRRMALKLKDKGLGATEIAKRMSTEEKTWNESSIRGLLDDDLAERNSRVENTANRIKKEVDEKKMIDIGKGVGLEIGASEEQMKAAVSILEQQGYLVQPLYVRQATDPVGGKITTQKILTTPDITREYMIKNKDQIGSLTIYTPDLGKTFGEIIYPESIDSKRVQIRYAEQGGKQKDGVIELRPGCEDLNLGQKHYAQVRIAVDNSHFLKGMAMYGDPSKFPEGVDVIFNTNKHVGTPKMDVLKPFKTDPRTGEVDKINPFGSLLRASGQIPYIGKDGKEHLSAINIVKQEGDWSDQARTVASQMLAKQNIPLIKKQLALSLSEYNAEYSDIKTLTNPSVKQKLLLSFGDKCDKAAAELKACSFPRQETHVILPIDSLKDNEIYAPKYRDGETVGLVRYPHAGPFELPVLKVNNRNAEAKRVITKGAIDAVGINTNVAEILSGADFDGDTVSVIPINSKIKLINSKSKASIDVAKRLENFDPKEEYPKVPGMKVMTKKIREAEMGKISNLITDMTLRGANADELSRAVKHSMVVIDAEKHELNYKQSYIDYGIKNLKKKYQGVNENGSLRGASTLISQAKAETHVPKISTRVNIDPDTGEKIYLPAKTQSRIDKKTGKEIKLTSNLDRMATVKDAFELSSGHPKETEYAKYANSLKALANTARKEAMKIKPIERNPSAAKIYENEVASLNSKLNQSLKNAPKERMAQRVANKIINDTTYAYRSNPNVEDLSKEEIRKLRQTSIANARAQVGAGKSKIKEITTKEWEAIQSGAISKTKLDKIINATDEDTLKKLAMPNRGRSIPMSKIMMIKARAESGWSQRDIADSLGISVSSVGRILKEG